MAAFRLNRSAFKAQTAEQAATHSGCYQKLSWQERLKVAAYLNSIEFKDPEGQPPKMDKTQFTTVARDK